MNDEVSACEALAQRPRPLAALIVLCGGLMGANDDELIEPPAGALEGLPVLLTGTEQDDWIEVQRVERTASVLGAAAEALGQASADERAEQRARQHGADVDECPGHAG